MQVDIQRLRRGMWWYATCCYQWIEATKHDEIFALEDRLGERLEYVLEAYRQSLSGKTCGVPSTVTEIATRIESDKLSVQQQGPADAETDSSSDSGCLGDSENDMEPVAASSKKTERLHRPVDSSMVVSSSGADEMDSLSLWAKAMQKYEVPIPLPNGSHTCPRKEYHSDRVETK